MKRGIYLVANKQSQEMCTNLIYSIRESGCVLPIRLIHFGGNKIDSPYILNQVEVLYYENFPEEAKQFILHLRSVLTGCPLGYLYRFLAWFLDWEEFVYTDNDIVALCNWEILFNYLANHELVHADEEYTTGGIYNYDKPQSLLDAFGDSALDSAITAGHLVVKRSDKMVADLSAAVNWFKENPGIPKKHDQALLHVASLLGNWNMLNLCKPPHNWLSSWAGDYKNSLELIQAIQTNNTKISHIHYSGGMPKGNLAIQDLLFSADSENKRLARLAVIALAFLSKYELAKHQIRRAKRFLNKRLF